MIRHEQLLLRQMLLRQAHSLGSAHPGSVHLEALAEGPEARQAAPRVDAPTVPQLVHKLGGVRLVCALSAQGKMPRCERQTD